MYSLGAFQYVKKPNTAGRLPTSSLNFSTEFEPVRPVNTLPFGGPKTCARAGAAVTSRTRTASTTRRITGTLPGRAD